VAVFSGAALADDLVNGILLAGATRHGLLIPIKDRSGVACSYFITKIMLAITPAVEPDCWAFAREQMAHSDTAEKFCNERYGMVRRSSAGRSWSQNLIGQRPRFGNFGSLPGSNFGGGALGSGAGGCCSLRMSVPSKGRPGNCSAMPT